MNSRNMTLVSDSNAQHKAFSFIKENILSMRFAPFHRLNAGDIAAQLGMSRTPVREALSRLEQDRLVVRDIGGGFSVRSISLGEILDFYRIREALEVEAALTALVRMNPQKLKALELILNKAESLLASSDYAEFVLANREFHAAIVDASENGAFKLIMGPIIDRVRLVGAMLIKLHAPRQREVYEENYKIFLALSRGDPRLVEEAVRAHVRQAREHAEHLLSTNLSSLFVSATG